MVRWDFVAKQMQNMPKILSDWKQVELCFYFHLTFKRKMTERLNSRQKFPY